MKELNQVESLIKDAIRYKKECNEKKAKQLLAKALELSKEIIVNATKDEVKAINRLIAFIADQIKSFDKKKASIEQPIKQMTFSSIIGHKEAKEEIFQNLIEPTLNPEINQKYNIVTSKGMLMYGPPGTGKTTFAKAVAGEIDAKFIHVQSNDILDKYIGESERKLNAIFDEANEKRTIILFDEFDQIASSNTSSDVSKRLVAQLKELIDGFSSNENVYILAATNYPDDIEFGIRRRLVPIYLGLPNTLEIEELLKLKLMNLPVEEKLNLKLYAEELEGYSGSDIDRIVGKASKSAARREREMKVVNPDYSTSISMRDIENAINSTPKSVSSRDIEIYQRYQEMISK